MTRLGSDGSANVKESLVACLKEAKRSMEAAEAAFEKSGDPPIFILKGSTTNKGSGIHIVHVFEQLVDICWTESEIREW
jgi:carbamoylphosphate synthase large subunit